ncbi:MAG: leucine-rich repeat protein [Candidatus Methanoplasma sp.]|nr:leucine-rich repeat protein [Candidatus Methanoplasma sp.]
MTYTESNESDADGGTSGSITWDLTDGVLTISGTGDMDDYARVPSTPDETTVPWWNEKDSIQVAVIEEGVTSVGAYAFHSHSSLRSVAIHDGVTSIGNAAFQNCAGLSSVSLPDSLRTIAGAAFNNATGLSSIIIPGEVTSIGEHAFAHTSLTSVTIPGEVTSISDFAFWGCTALTSVTILSSEPVSIGTYAFFGCTALTSVDILSSVKTIGVQTFQNCTSLTSIDLHTVETIGDRAFSGCTALISIVIPDSASTSNSFTNAVIETVTVAGSYTDTNGIISKYFSNGKAWKLPGATSAAKYLILPNIISSDYDPNAVGSDIGIAKVNGGELHFKDAVYTCDGSSWTEDTAAIYSVSGAVDDGSTGIAGARVSLGTNGAYTAVTGSGGAYTIANVPDGTYTVTVSKTGYDTGTDSVTISSADASDKDITLDVSKYKIKGIIKAGGDPVKNAEVSFGSHTASHTNAYGEYIISGIPYGTSGSITVKDGTVPEGYHQVGTVSVLTNANISGLNITLEINRYEVTLSEGMGISGFTYTVNGGPEVPYSMPFTVKHNDTLVITALLSEGYAFDSWSGPASSDKTLTISVSEDIALTASASQIPVPSSPSYSITFSSGSYYTVYDAKGPVSSPISVAGGGTLLFSVNASEGYSASPSVISGNAEIIPQTDGWYRISDIRSDVRITVTVSAIADNSSAYGSSGNGLGGGDSGNDVSYWIPVLTAGVFAVCIGAAAIGHTVLIRRKG